MVGRAGCKMCLDRQKLEATVLKAPNYRHCLLVSIFETEMGYR